MKEEARYFGRAQVVMPYGVLFVGSTCQRPEVKVIETKCICNVRGSGSLWSTDAWWILTKLVESSRRAVR